MKARGGGDGPVWRVAFVAMPTPSGGDWARGSRGGGLRAPAGRGSAGVILLGGGSPDLTACGWGAGVHGRCMLVIWRAASRRIKGPRGPRRLTPHAMGALSACATSACEHVSMWACDTAAACIAATAERAVDVHAGGSALCHLAAASAHQHAPPEGAPAPSSPAFAVG
jgi:hypothetical protein